MAIVGTGVLDDGGGGGLDDVARDAEGRVELGADQAGGAGADDGAKDQLLAAPIQ